MVKGVNVIPVLIVLLISNEVAADVWVDAGVATSGDGTEGDPYKTIQEGVTNVAEGETVHLAAGSYAQSTIIDKSVTILGPGNPDPDVVLDIALTASVTGTDDEHTFIINHTSDNGTVTIQNLIVAGDVDYDGVHIAGTNQAAVSVVNCDFSSTTSVGVHVVAGDGNGFITIRWCNFGVDAVETSIGVQNDDTDITVQATDNWWNSYLGPGMDETYDSVPVRYAATKDSGTGAVDGNPWPLGRYRIDSDSDGEPDNTDLDDDNDTAPDKGEIALGIDPLDSGSKPAIPLPPNVYVDSAWSVNTLGDAVGDDYTFGYDAFSKIQDAVHGVRDNE